MNFLFHLGRYLMMLKKVFSRPERWRLYLKQLSLEMDKIGISSVPIIVIVSLFMGAVMTLQVAYNVESPFVMDYLIGLSTRDTMMLEFSSTMVGLILAGKVGSNIASEIGTMRISEQIDAMEMMGVNSASFLILPKLLAAVLFSSIFTIVSIAVGLIGGYLVAVFTDAVTVHDYVLGLHTYFIPFYLYQALIKSAIFAIILTTVPAYHGFYVSGGALEVGKASTKAVVFSSIIILMFNLILTQLLLAK